MPRSSAFQTSSYQAAFGESRPAGRPAGEDLTQLAAIRRLARLNLPVETIAQGVEKPVAEVQQIIDLPSD